MNPQEIALVRASFTRLLPLADRAVPRYFAHLLAIDPSQRRHVSNAVVAAGLRRLPALGGLLHRLDNPRACRAPLLELLNDRSMQPRSSARLAKLARAVMMTLQDMLGAEFDAPCRAAWGALYFLALGVMAEEAACCDQAVAA